MKLYKNIVEEKDRKKLLKFVKTKVKYWNDKVPGLQTPMDLHTHPETQHFYKKILQKYFKDMSIQYSWANYSEGDIINWHNHPAATISAVETVASARFCDLVETISLILIRLKSASVLVIGSKNFDIAVLLEPL